jgi:hypothetical protein
MVFANHRLVLRQKMSKGHTNIPTQICTVMVTDSTSQGALENKLVSCRHALFSSRPVRREHRLNGLTVMIPDWVERAVMKATEISNVKPRQGEYLCALLTSAQNKSLMCVYVFSLLVGI